MKNQKLQNIVESAKDLYYGPLMPAIFCAGFYGTFAVNGFYRGFHNMPITPEHLDQVTGGDITAAVVGGASELVAIVDGLSSKRYSDGARSAAGIIGLPIIGALTHAIGYAIGKVLQ